MSTSSIEHLPTAHYRSSNDDRTVTAVIRATLDELEDRGYAAASLGTISARAQVPLETVFSRWSSKQHLVFDAIDHLARNQPTPDTGNAHDDLLQVTESLVALLAHPGAGEVLRSILSSVGDADPRGSAADVTLRIGVLTERRSAVQRIIERGQRRQQFPSSTHSGLAADAIIGALVYRLLLSHEPIDRRTAAGIVAVVTPT